MRTFAFILAGAVGLLGLLGTVGCENRAQSTVLSEMPRTGAAFTLEINSDVAANNTNRLADLKEAMIRRFSKFGSQFYWEPQSETRVRVVVPAAGRNSFEAVKGFIAHAGRLEFRLVHPHSEQLIRDGVNAHDYEVVERTVEPSGTVVPIPAVLFQKELGTPQVERILVKKPDPDLAGDLLEKVEIGTDPLGFPQLEITLKLAPAAALEELTRANIGGKCAVILDGQVYCISMIHAQVGAGMFVLTGGPDRQKTANLFLILTHPYPVSVKLLDVKIL